MYLKLANIAISQSVHCRYLYNRAFSALSICLPSYVTFSFVHVCHKLLPSCLPLLYVVVTLCFHRPQWSWPLMYTTSPQSILWSQIDFYPSAGWGTDRLWTSILMYSYRLVMDQECVQVFFHFLSFLNTRTVYSWYGYTIYLIIMMNKIKTICTCNTLGYLRCRFLGHNPCACPLTLTDIWQIGLIIKLWHIYLPWFLTTKSNR